MPPVSFHSSIDSERNVHGLSLAFLRWLLHAALVSSPKIKHCSGVFGLNTYDDIITYLQGRLENDFQGLLFTYFVYNNSMLLLNLIITD